ncbi:MAG: DUF5335 family protein [Gemmatimonadota bacterium]
MLTKIPRNEWREALQAFTERNAGRTTAIEVDDTSIGAQRQETDFELRGVAYDSRDDRIEIMLGPLEGPAPHLTHTLGSVEELDLITNEAGRDTVLRLRQEGRQTLLLIEQPEALIEQPDVASGA